MAERWAVNASPLIFLARVSRLDLLRDVAQSAVVPQSVMRELEAGSDLDDAMAVVRRSDWLLAVDDPVVPESVRIWDLGAGESAVLAWAIAHPSAEAVIDDLQARRCAASLGIPVRGTLGVVLVAEQRGLISAARPIIEELRAAGMYLSDAVIERALSMVGE